MSEQETAVFSSCKCAPLSLTNIDSQATTDGEILPKTEDTLDYDINIYIILKKHRQSLLAKAGVKGLDIDFNGRPSILIFVEDKKQVTNLPNKLDGFPVEIIEGEAFFS